MSPIREKLHLLIRTSTKRTVIPSVMYGSVIARLELCSTSLYSRIIVTGWAFSEHAQALMISTRVSIALSHHRSTCHSNRSLSCHRFMRFSGIRSCSLASLGSSKSHLSHRASRRSQRQAGLLPTTTTVSTRSRCMTGRVRRAMEACGSPLWRLGICHLW